MTYRDELRDLPRLSRQNALSQALACLICADFAPFFDVADFNKSETYAFGRSGIAVEYYRCRGCGFMFTPFFANWTADDFAEFIYNDDYIKVDPEFAGARPRRLARHYAGQLSQLRHLPMLDYGSGNGGFAEHMRVEGFRFEAYDPYFSPERPNREFDVVTCFEVLEHSPDPVATVRDMASMLRPGGMIIIGQSLQPANIEDIGVRWRYAMPRNGHMSLHTNRSLCLLAQQVGFDHFNGGTSHVFAWNDSPISRGTMPSGPREVPFLRLVPDRRSGWHSVEFGEQGSFVWSADDRVPVVPRMWLQSSEVRLELDLVDEVFPGFADQCSLLLRDSQYPLVRIGRKLSAEVPFAIAPSDSVALLTPPPVSPAELGRLGDDRKLGVAISV